MAYDIGGGGGPFRRSDENDKHSLSKSFELSWPPSPEQWAELDALLTQLTRNASTTEDDVTELQDVEIPEAEEQIVKQATINVTELQLESGNTSPITLVAAQTGKVIIPLQAVIVVTTTSVYTSSPTWSLRHGGAAGNLTGTVAPNLQATVTGQHLIGMLTTFGFSADPTGRSLVLFLNANPTGTGTATAKVHITYYLTDSISTV